MTGDEIPWVPAPGPQLARVPVAALLALDADDLLAYAVAVQEELEAVQALLHEALAALARARQQRQRLETRVALLVDDVRQAHAARGAIGAQLRQRKEPA